MQTARGSHDFTIYEGRVIIDGQEFIVPVHVGDEIPEILIGAQVRTKVRTTNCKAIASIPVKLELSTIQIKGLKP